jgi:hypothetical protein
MPIVSRKAWPMDFLPSILRITRESFYLWAGFLRVKKVSVREDPQPPRPSCRGEVSADERTRAPPVLGRAPQK